MTRARLQLLAELASEAADYAASDSPAWARRMTDAAHVARAMVEREDRELELQGSALMAKRAPIICQYCECDTKLSGLTWVDVDTGLPFCRNLTTQERGDPDAVPPAHEPFRSEGPPA